jgi:hypothetical protein
MNNVARCPCICAQIAHQQTIINTHNHRTPRGAHSKCTPLHQTFRTLRCGGVQIKAERRDDRGPVAYGDVVALRSRAARERFLAQGQRGELHFARVHIGKAEQWVVEAAAAAADGTGAGAGAGATQVMFVGVVGVQAVCASAFVRVAAASTAMLAMSADKHVRKLRDRRRYAHLNVFLTHACFGGGYGRPSALCRRATVWCCATFSVACCWPPAPSPPTTLTSMAAATACLWGRRQWRRRRVCG